MLQTRRREIGKQLQELLKKREQKRGLLIAFEGPDGSGKTTQRKHFTTWLQGEGLNVVTTKWNSAPLIQPLVKARKRAKALSPREFSLIHAAEFRYRLDTQILPALWRGNTVVADRHFFTGLARDAARGMDTDWLLQVYAPLFFPDIVYYFRVSADVSAKRIAADGDPKYYEAGQDVTGLEDPHHSYTTFLNRVIQEYDSLAKIFRFVTLDGEQPIFQLHKQIRETYQKHQEKRSWADWNKEAVLDWLSNHPEVLEAKPTKVTAKLADEDDDA